MRSIGARLTWGYALVVLITIIVTMIVGYFLLRRELIRGIDLLNFAEFREIRARVEVKHQPMAENEFMKKVAEHAEIDAPLYYFQVRRKNGEVVFRSPNLGSVVLDANPEHRSHLTNSSSSLGMIRVGQFREGMYDVQIATSLKDIRQFSAYYLQVSVVVSGVALVLSVFFGHRLSRLALDPIRRIQQTAEHISADNLSMRIPSVRGNDEIAGLVRLLNQMFDRLESSFDRLGRFASDASHELKTPLSIIRLQSEKLLLHGNLPGGQQEIVQQQLEGIARLNSVVEKLLFLAKSKVGGIRPNAKRQDAAEFVRQFDEDARVLCEDQQVSFEVVRNDSLSATFDATLLRHVLLNLLTNALHVTPAGARITLASSLENGRWLVRVADFGPGLPPEQLERIFEPFTRVESLAGNGNSDVGTGLGLAICRSILEVHHGRIWAQNRGPEPGLLVCFELSRGTRSEPENKDSITPAHSRRKEEFKTVPAPHPG